MIEIRENFISESRVQALLSACRGLSESAFGGEGFWSGRVVRLSGETREMRSIANAVTREIQAEIHATTGKKLHPDCRNFTRWRKGDWMGLHADGEYEDGSYNWRQYGAILYLNDDFEGGEIHFPNQGLELKPKPGTLVFFPGKLPYLHGVHEVTSGVRYNMASFWTDDETRNVIGEQDD